MTRLHYWPDWYGGVEGWIIGMYASDSFKEQVEELRQATMLEF
jgi:hypothetical protein